MEHETLRTICIASTAVCLCLARPYATKAHSHSHTRASRVHHSLPHCSHPALAPHILKPLPTTTLPHAASSLCSTAAIPNDARSTLSPLVSMRCAPLPPPPYSHTAMWWRVRPPAAHHHGRHHRNVRPRRPQVPSTQSQQRQPHDDAPQQRHTATAAEQRRPHVRPQAPAVAAPQAAITHTPTCMHTHTHDMRHET